MKMSILLATQSIELQQKQGSLSGIAVVPDGEDWLLIKLVSEGLELWLGHTENRGYFITWNKAQEPSSYFELDGDLGRRFGLVRSVVETPKRPTADHKRIALKLVDTLNSAEPDREMMRDLIDELPATPESFDSFSSAVTIRTFHEAVAHLKHMLEDSSRPEAEYRDFIAKRPWFLGSHYASTLTEEFQLWFDSRTDLMLASVLGHIDIVELKRPTIAILKKGLSSNTWKTTEPLAEAFGQARKYLKNIDENRHLIERRLKPLLQANLRIFRSGIIIVAGRTPVEDGALEELRDINTSNGRILVLTYDDLVAIGEATIRIFENRFSGVPLALSRRGSTSLK